MKSFGAVRFLLLVWCSCLSCAALAQNFSIGRKPSWVNSFRVDDTVKAAATGSFYYLLEDQQISIPQQENFNHTAIKILTSEGLQEVSDIRINFDPSYQKLTIHAVDIHRDGKIIPRLSPGIFKTIQREEDADRYLYDDRLSAITNLKDIRVGDIVEYSYTLRGFNPVHGNNFAAERYFQYNVLVFQHEFSIQTNARIPLSVVTRNGMPDARITTTGNITTYAWSVEQAPVWTSEGHLPSWFLGDKMVSVSTPATWGDVVRWTQPRFALAPGEKEKIAAFAREKFPAKDDRTFAEHAIRFVQDEVRYLGIESGVNSHKPHQPLQTLEQRFGDCKDKSFLLATILNARGIEAWPMLINTDQKLKLSEILPSDNAFDHCVVRLRYGGREYDIDPTIGNQGGSLDSISFPNYGKGLVVRDQETELVTFEHRSIGKTEEFELLELPEKGDSAIMIIRTKYTGGFADDERSSFASSSLERIQECYRKFYHDLYPDLKSVGVLTITDDRRANIVTVKEKYLIPNIWEPEEGTSRRLCKLYPLSLEHYFSVNKAKQRTAPYALTYPLHYVHHLTVRMPSDKTIDPDSKRIETGSYRYKYKLYAQASEVYMDTEYETKKDYVAADSTARFVADHDTMTENLSYYLYDMRSSSSSGTSASSDENPVNTGVVAASGLLTIMSVGFCLWIYRRYDPVPSLENTGGIYIGGWLILFAFGLVISPIRMMIEFYGSGDYFRDESLQTYFLPINHWLAPFLAIEFFYNSTLIPFSILLAVLFFQRRSSTPKLVRIYLAVNGAITIMEIVVQMLSVTPNLTYIVKYGFAAVIGLGIWLPYFKLSERVRETFVVRI